MAEEQHEATQEAAAQEYTKQHSLVTYQSMISMGGDGLRALLLVNGAAVVAILAYVGQARRGRFRVAQAMFCPLSLFLIALFLVLAAFFTAYRTQYVYFAETIGLRNRPASGTWLVVTAMLAGFAVVLFAVGSVVALLALSAQ